jgi:hypothetical protein
MMAALKMVTPAPSMNPSTVCRLAAPAWADTVEKHTNKRIAVVMVIVFFIFLFSF